MEPATPTVYADLLTEAAPPARGILSRTISKADGVELVLFAFAAGEALSEHTSSRPAILHVLAGEGDLTVDGEHHDARPGTWARMPANCRHAIVARTPLVMALYLLPGVTAS
jgi:quercetin dioxygenase-like cupin family protein